ncbi:hypothetical protein LC048_00770 [Mesobacillus subterraneus]|uniref:YobI family P-loop NTPase n=1 Tax=Mesobacillus subterraneus TaxID=285983 RepID=UPI001CFF0048|nr:hypothetical protein [Mesobacillus subterraneus]WLR55586.1 hypothetical protein LC048_00770 [Mesobacillus subterraneus]
MNLSIIDFISRLVTKFKRSSESREENGFRERFEDLTPKNNIDKNGHYSNAIAWALENNNINNIALTGPYGSGKSSILKTFQSENINSYKFLNISLASFKEEEEENENILEKGILQQMFYKVPSKTLPFSRFKRIRNERKRSMYVKVLFLVSFLILGLHLFNPSYLAGLYKNTTINESFTAGNIVSKIFTVLLLFTFLAYLIILTTNLFNFLGRNLKLSKLTLPNATIEIDKESESSIFDKYLDEIIYFFETTEYQVVVFEDLDRFNNLEIFERLRSLNTLINNSDQINRRVVFLYAIKDDMFGSEDDMFSSRNRTKFFDFIIPVIPVINSSNSYQILKNKLKTTPGAEAITEDLINDITFYIDDMRILINICNEYNLYKEILGTIDLIENNLLAMIVYKNIYPKDFADLQFNDGMVYKVFQNKTSFIGNRINELESEYFKIENDINNVENEALSSRNELDIVYAEALGLNHTNNSIYLDGTQFIGGNWRGLNFFEKLDSAREIRYHSSTSGWRHPNPTREQIATIFDTKVNYFERLKLIKIKEENRIDKLKLKLELLSKEKQEVLAWSLKDIINKSTSEEIFTEKIREKKLLMYLIRHGYIDEMYSQYMNYFYPGSITNEDMKFLMSVKDQEPLPFNFSLSNVNKIVEKLYGKDFKRLEVLNYDLIEYLLANNSHNGLFLETVIEQLVNQSKESISFIDNFKDITNFKGVFLKLIGKRWIKMWHYIQIESNYSIQKTDEYLEDILRFVDIEDIIAMNIQDELTQYISCKEEFFEIFPNVDDLKMQQILKELKVKFRKIKLPLPDHSSIISFIYENNLYMINPEMVKLIIDIKAGEENILNFTNITRTNLQSLVEYIDENINEYIENVFLKLEKNHEDEKTIVELLNREDIKEHLKVKIIQHFEGKLELITSVGTPFWKEFLIENKLISNWANLLSHYAEFKKIDSSVLEFLNNESNSIELAHNNLEDIDGFDQEMVEEFSSEITQTTEIMENCFEKIASSLISWSSFPIKELPYSRVEILINSNVLVLSNENYTSLKEYFEPLHLSLIEKHIETFINDITSFDVDPKDVISLLESDRITYFNKRDMINNLNENLISQDLNLTIILTRFLINHKPQVKDSLLDIILDTKVSKSDKIHLLACQIKNLDNEQITKHLQTLKSPYSDITENGKRPVLEDTLINRELLGELNEINYISSWSQQKEKLRVNTKHK